MYSFSFLTAEADRAAVGKMIRESMRAMNRVYPWDEYNMEAADQREKVTHLRQQIAYYFRKHRVLVAIEDQSSSLVYLQAGRLDGDTWFPVIELIGQNGAGSQAWPRQKVFWMEYSQFLRSQGAVRSVFETRDQTLEETEMKSIFTGMGIKHRKRAREVINKSGRKYNMHEWDLLE